MENEIFNTVPEAVILLQQYAVPIGLYMTMGACMRSLEVGYEIFVEYKSDFDEQVKKRIGIWFWEPKVMNKRPEYSREQNPQLKKSFLTKTGEALSNFSAAILGFPREFARDKVAIGCVIGGASALLLGLFLKDPTLSGSISGFGSMVTGYGLGRPLIRNSD